MAPVVGKYIFEKEENLNAYFKGLGLEDDQIQGIQSSSKELEITANGNEYTISSGLGSRTFPLGTQIEEKLRNGSVLKTVASASGNKLVLKSVGEDLIEGERVYEATDSGLVLTLSTEGKGSGKIYFKRA